MKIITLIGMGAVASAVVFGCGGTGTGSAHGTEGNGSTSGEQAGGGDASTPSHSSDAGGSAASEGDAGGSAASEGDAEVNAETDYTQTKTITMDPFPVPAQSEVFYCQSFANPWGKQVDIKTYDLTMDTGSHHMFAFYESNATDGAVAACPAGGLTFGAFTFTSQTPKVSETFPPTVGATIPTTTGFNMMAHYLNTGTTALTAHVSLTMYVAKSGVVTNHAGVIYDNNVRMTVPATGQPVVSTQSATLNQDVNIITAASHMHKFGTNFISTATAPDGSMQTLYQTTNWDEPKATVFATPVHLVSGTTITWSCTDVNTTGQTLTFGEYAETNVMCIAVNIFYPVQDVTNPVLGSTIGGF